MAEAIVLAVDGGATKTTLKLCTKEGQILFENTTSGSNYQTLGKEAVQSILKTLLLDAYQAINQYKIELAVFAMAGIDTPQDLEIACQIVKGSCKQSPFDINKIVVENDVLATLHGLMKGRPGALIISGTGAVAYASDGKGNIVRTGGWGHRAGDEGSGYWIGREILNIIFKTEDGRSKKPTVLPALLYEKLQIENVEQLNSWLYRPQYTNAQIASVSSILSKAVALADEQAINVAQNAAKELSILAISTLEKIKYDNTPFTIYLNGGVFKHNPIIHNLFTQYTNETYPNLSVKLCDKDPIDYIMERAIFVLK